MPLVPVTPIVFNFVAGYPYQAAASERHGVTAVGNLDHSDIGRNINGFFNDHGSCAFCGYVGGKAMAVYVGAADA